MHPMLNTAVKALRRGAAIINRASFDLDRVTITSEPGKQVVTDAEGFAFDAIADVLKQAYPNHHIFDFEASLTSHAPADLENVWLIQPLNGNINFLHGNPQYCLSVTLQQLGVPMHTVIFDPNRNDLFSASKGGGAHQNEKRIRVTKQDKLLNALLASRQCKNDDNPYKIMAKITAKSHGVVCTGSSILDLSYVAAGKIDGACFQGLQQRDIVASTLLIVESGGIIGNFVGESDTSCGNVIAGNPKIYAQLLPLLTPFA